jgi:hypothetical protein
MKKLPLKSGDETNDQIIKIIHGLIINDDDDVNNSQSSNPVSNESRTPENELVERRSPINKVTTTKTNRKKKDTSDRVMSPSGSVTSPRADMTSPSGGTASPVADVTSPSGGAVRNVGPRLAKEVAAKKDGRKEKKMKERKEKKETKKKGNNSDFNFG